MAASHATKLPKATPSPAGAAAAAAIAMPVAMPVPVFPVHPSGSAASGPAGAFLIIDEPGGRHSQRHRHSQLLLLRDQLSSGTVEEDAATRRRLREAARNARERERVKASQKGPLKPVGRHLFSPPPLPDEASTASGSGSGGGSGWRPPQAAGAAARPGSSRGAPRSPPPPARHNHQQQRLG